MPDTSKVEASNFQIDTRLAGVEGAESQVYKGIRDGKNVAVKIYKNFTIDQVLLYQEITNSLAQKHNNEGIELLIKGVKYKLQLQIVPIDEVVMINSNPLDKSEVSPSSISSFIEGQTLFDLDKHYMSNRPAPIANDPLVKLSAQFRRETAVDNISIIPWNVKPLLDQNPPVLVITDLAGSVKSIKRTET